MFDQFLSYVDGLAFSQFVRENEMAFPWIESFHVLAVAIVIGSIFIVDARLIGLRSYRKNASGVISDLLPYTWAAFILAVLTGAMMFCSDAVRYGNSQVFQAKVVALVLAGANMGIFHATEFRRIADWDVDITPPAGARFAGVASIAVWTSVVFLGRWIGFE
jgi:uncharacterized membrane protein